VSESNNFETRKQLSEKMLTAKVPGGVRIQQFWN